MQITPGPSAHRSLQVLAVSRLFWIMSITSKPTGSLGIEIAQMALWFGPMIWMGQSSMSIFILMLERPPDILTVGQLHG
ncbi:MAG: hypothetical protein IPI28_19365 [Candidatus Omnitrophica bacterium]|nr:hypothetical protein [Candidatus Omnitrophota bacterium]